MPKRTVDRDAMLAAHVQYELAQLTSAALAPALRREVAALYGWLGALQTGDLVKPEQLLAFVRRIVTEYPLPAEVSSFLHENAVIALELAQDEQGPLRLFVPDQVVAHVVEKIASMPAARQQITHRIVSSSVYSRLIANVLYHGIKSFLVSEHGVARTIPGAAAFVRMGQNALNAAAPRLEKNVDRQLLTFVNDNIQQLIAESETFLNRTLDEVLIHKVGDELWQSMKDEPLAQLAATLDKQALGGWTETGQDLWKQWQTTPLFDDILQAVVRSFFLRYGKRTVADVLALLGLNEETAARELQVLAEPVVERALASGYLEDRIRARLEPFYTGYFAAGENATAQHKT